MIIDTFGEEYEFPSWPARENPTMSSQVWNLDIDNMGNIWFTDEIQNALWRFPNDTKSFEMITVLEKPEAFGTTYPVSMEIDNNGSNIYFIGIRFPSIWIGSSSQMRNATAEGIERIEIPLDPFTGIDPDLVSTGSIILDEDNSSDNLWVTDHGISIFYRLNPTSEEITKFTTSTVSPRILGQNSATAVSYTLPYWIKTGENGTI